MDANHIHIFLEKILKTAHCPKCHKKLSIGNIKVQSSTEKTCTFQIHCDKCNNKAIAQAVLKIEPIKKEALESISPPVISEEEIIHAQNILTKNINIDSFFK